MGCDGGSIPKRDEMVRLKKKGEKVDKNMELAAKWRHCAITADKLRQPIVSCELGRLYNKESLLMALLDKDNIPEIVRHVRSLKDVTEIKLTPNPSYQPSEKNNDDQSSQYICPISNLEMNGHHPFIYLRGCGCVLSDKALKEVPSDTCHKCGIPYTKDDIIIINGSDDEVEKLKVKMDERRQAVKLSKRKRKAESQQVETDQPSTSVPSSGVNGTSEVDKRPKITATAGKKKGVASSGNGVESRKAYKSMFTSSAPPRSRDNSSHWVTFFPYH